VTPPPECGTTHITEMRPKWSSSSDWAA